MINLFNKFKTNKIDYTCGSQVEEDKLVTLGQALHVHLKWKKRNWLVTLGLAYGNILNYEQTFCQKKERKSHMDRTDELRRKISRVHSVNSNTVNKPIYAQKGYNLKAEIKCTVKIKKIGIKKCTFKNNTSFLVDLP